MQNRSQMAPRRAAGMGPDGDETAARDPSLETARDCPTTRRRPPADLDEPAPPPLADRRHPPGGSAPRRGLAGVPVPVPAGHARARRAQSARPRARRDLAASSGPAASADPSPAAIRGRARSSARAPPAAPSTARGTSTRRSARSRTSSGPFVGYRVEEELANVGAATAVGRTPDVTGSLTFAGSTVSAADFTANLSTPPERSRPARRPAPPPGARDRHLPDRDVQAHEANRPWRGPDRRPGRLGHGDRRPDDPRHDEVGPDPDPGTAVRRSRDGHRLDRHRRSPTTRHQPAELVPHGPLDRGPRDDGVPAPAHEGLGAARQAEVRRPRRSRGAGRGRPRASSAGASAMIATSAQSSASSGVAWKAADRPGTAGISAWIAITSTAAVARNVVARQVLERQRQAAAGVRPDRLGDDEGGEREPAGVLDSRPDATPSARGRRKRLNDPAAAILPSNGAVSSGTSRSRGARRMMPGSPARARTRRTSRGR